MGYIIKLISKDSDKELKKVLDIAKKFFKNKDEVEVTKYFKELEKNGFVICKKIKI